MTDDELAAFTKNMADPMWRISHLYKIIIKGDEGEDNLVIQFKPNRAQRRFIENLWHRNIILKARQLGFCVSPDTRILTADLTWVPIGEIQPGTEIIACDEHPPGGRGAARRMNTATVCAVNVMRAQRYQITFDDGRQVTCTDRHPWLTRKTGTDAKWRSISGQGNEVVGKLQIGTKVRWITKPWGNQTVEDGWFGGMLDGEGSIAKSNSSAGINVAQRTGPVWDRLLKYSSDRGYNSRIESDLAERPGKFGKTPVPKLCFGRMDEMFRLIGQTRPTRFIGRRFWEDRELPGKRNGGIGWAEVTNIEHIGEGDVVDMQTTSGTYIAEGFVSHNTTLIAIVWLDHALFNANSRCGIIAQDREAAKVIFRDKVKFAYQNLPEALKSAMPLAADNADELLFGHNNSSIRVATSMRSGTIHRLHVSEFGKICAKFPDKAKEVITGSIPAVPLSGITIIESTAEGAEGAFHDMTQRAMELTDKKSDLTQRDYRFHFFPWWQEEKYRMNPDGVIVTDKDNEYFDKIEADGGAYLDDAQRAWYVATRDADFVGEQEAMWQEYPSSPSEPFKVSVEGCYYTNQLTVIRKQGRILRIPVLNKPVNTFWDIGNSDGTAIWFHQQVGMEDRFIGYYEEHGEDLPHFVRYLQNTGYVFNKHFLPHDAGHVRLGIRNESIESQLKSLGLTNTKVIPVTSSINAAIQLTRDHMATCYFDEVGCKVGLQRLAGYKKRWNASAGRWSDEPMHDINSEGADAFRQFAQAKAAGFITVVGSVKPPVLPRVGSFRSGTGLLGG